MFFGRLDYQDKERRLQDKAMEFVWKGSPNLGNNLILLNQFKREKVIPLAK